MRTELIGLIVVAVSVFVVSPRTLAQTAPRQAGAQAVPNLHGIWEVPNDLAVKGKAGDICAEPACRALLGVPPAPRLDKNLDEPQMLPWAEQQYKSVREGLRDPNAFANQELRPFWGGCTPEGPVESVRRRAFEVVQFPDVVLLLFDHDHAVRRIYLDGRGHPANGKSTWMGHSTGKYDGDTLVVDTVGISDKAWIDVQGHPHTDALRLTERIRRVDQKTLEIEMTIDDPKTYSKPWRKNVIHKLQPPEVPNVWDSTECEEILEMGTHYSAESKKESQPEKPSPAATY
jgi:hypothetical protein